MGGGNTHPMTTFFSLLNIVDENDLKKIKFGPIIMYFPIITLSIIIK